MAQDGSSAPGDTAQSLEAAHRALLERRDIQFRFSEMEPPTPLKLPDWLETIGQAIGRFFGMLGPAFVWIFWGLVAAAVLGLLYLVAREAGWLAWTSRSKKRRGAPSPDVYRPDAAVANALLADADELARQGRFAEAVHVILLRSVEDIRRYRPRAVRPAATSRDLAALEILPQQARMAFAAMARAVEVSLFGGRPVDESDYQRCRKDYEAFAFPEVWA